MLMLMLVLVLMLILAFTIICLSVYLFICLFVCLSYLYCTVNVLPLLLLLDAATTFIATSLSITFFVDCLLFSLQSNVLFIFVLVTCSVY